MTTTTRLLWVLTGTLGALVGWRIGSMFPTMRGFDIMGAGIGFVVLGFATFWIEPEKIGTLHLDCGSNNAWAARENLCSFPPTECPRDGNRLVWWAEPVRRQRTEPGASHMTRIAGYQYHAACSDESCYYRVLLPSHLPPGR